MKKGKVQDLLSAVKDEAVAEVVGSELVPTVVSDIADVVVSEGTALILGGVVGAISPRINGVRLGYKQAQFERKVNLALQSMAKRIDDLDERYNALNAEVQTKFRTTYLEWLLDNLYAEKQDSKVKYHINGYINMMCDGANDNLMLMFFDTINQLTELDIDALKIYSYDSDTSIWDLCKKYDLQPEQVGVIKEKLTRLGLLFSKNEELRDNNTDEIVEYLQKFDKDIKSKKPKGVALPKIKKPNRMETYAITSLGRSYLKIISAE